MPHVKDTKWVDTANKVALYRFPLSDVVGHDTMVVQLTLDALHEAEEASVAWEKLARQLEAVFSQATDAVFKDLWGYTLTYYAVVDTTAELQGVEWDSLLPTVQSKSLLINSPNSPHKKVAHLTECDVEKGRLWLAYKPVEGAGLKACTVYLAVSLRNKPNEPEQDRFFRGVLYDSNAILLIPDLIAHKGYHEIQQHRFVTNNVNYETTGTPAMNYTTAMDNARNAAIALLRLSEEGMRSTVKHTELSSKYRSLVGAVSKLLALRISLAKQLYNYQLWKKRPGIAPLTSFQQMMDFHYNRLQTGAEELKLEIEEGQTVLKTANTAVKIVQAQIDQDEEERKNWVEILIGIASVVLAVPQLITPDIAQVILNLIPPTGLLVMFNLPISTEDTTRLAQLGVQVICVVLGLFMLFIILGVVKWLKWR
jgi:hypothetical protein